MMFCRAVAIDEALMLAAGEHKDVEDRLAWLKNQIGRYGVVTMVRCGNVEQIPPPKGPALCADAGAILAKAEESGKTAGLKKWWKKHADGVCDCARPDEARTFTQQRRARHEPTQRIVDLLLRGALKPDEHPEDWARLMTCFRPRGMALSPTERDADLRAFHVHWTWQGVVDGVVTRM
jgi:hypothetical protein